MMPALSYSYQYLARTTNELVPLRTYKKKRKLPYAKLQNFSEMKKYLEKNYAPGTFPSA